MPTQTIYIAPGNSQCRVYLIPYPMRPGQSPRDIDPRYHADWKEVALLNHKLELVYIDKEVEQYRDDIDGAPAGCFWEV